MPRISHIPEALVPISPIFLITAVSFIIVSLAYFSYGGGKRNKGPIRSYLDLVISLPYYCRLQLVRY